MQRYYRFYPQDQDGLEAMFQAKRARLQVNRQDYSIMYRTYEFLADLQLPDVPARPFSFCLPKPFSFCLPMPPSFCLPRPPSFCPRPPSFYLPGDITPEWFSHKSWGSTVTFQLSSQWANSEFLGFSLCAVIVSSSFNFELQVKCTYHFRNKHGDSRDLYCYLDGWFDDKGNDPAHIFVGLDPCLVAKEKDTFSKYSEVSVEFQPEDMNGTLLLSDFCQVVECGVHLLHANEMDHFDFSMQDDSCFHPPDRDELKAVFQAKRERLQGMRRDDYFGYVFSPEH
ncbi:disease resistance protein RPP2B-like [Populus alba]|uniref:disease resistance protein RPP2B-like n=1 Tax=Populus alba TaxID=43335 RepID=UPI003CC790BC